MTILKVEHVETMKYVLISVIHSHNDARDLQHPAYHMPSDISTWDLPKCNVSSGQKTQLVWRKLEEKNGNASGDAEIWMGLQEGFLQNNRAHKPKITQLSFSPFTTTFLCFFTFLCCLQEKSSKMITLQWTVMNLSPYAKFGPGPSSLGHPDVKSLMARSFNFNPGPWRSCGVCRCTRACVP